MTLQSINRSPRVLRIFLWISFNSQCFMYIPIDRFQCLMFYIYSYRLVTILCFYVYPYRLVSILRVLQIFLQIGFNCLFCLHSYRLVSILLVLHIFLQIGFNSYFLHIFLQIDLNSSRFMYVPIDWSQFFACYKYSYRLISISCFVYIPIDYFLHIFLQIGFNSWCSTYIPVD